MGMFQMRANIMNLMNITSSLAKGGEQAMIAFQPPEQSLCFVVFPEQLLVISSRAFRLFFHGGTTGFNPIALACWRFSSSS